MIGNSPSVFYLFSQVFTDFSGNQSRKLCVKRFLMNHEKINFYWTRVNFRLNPKFVLDVGKVLATKGLFIV